MFTNAFKEAYNIATNTLIQVAGHQLRLAGAVSAKLYQYPNGLIESAEYDRRVRAWEEASRRMLGVPA